MQCLVALVCGCSILLAGCTAGERSSPGSAAVARLVFPAFTFTPPRVGDALQRSVLANGMVLYTAQDPSAPILKISMSFRAGDIYERPSMRGAAQLLGSQIRLGGTDRLSPAELITALEQLGVTTEDTHSSEIISLTMTGLSRDASRIVELLAAMVQHPRFDPAAFQTSKDGLAAQLRRSLETPSQLASQEFARILYPETHPLGRPLLPSQVRRLSVDDVREHYRRFVRPDNAWLTVVSDLPSPAIRESIEQRFAGWALPPTVIPDLPSSGPGFRPGCYVFPAPLPQATVNVGHPGVSGDTPDRYAIDVMNTILGGDQLGSRLAKRIRTEAGMTYAVSSTLPTTARTTGLLRISLQTRNRNVPAAVGLVLDELRRMQRDPVSREELDSARDLLSNSLLFRFYPTANAVAALVEAELNGESPGFYAALLQRYRAVTIADIQRVAREYLHPERATILVVGRPDALDTVQLDGRPAACTHRPAGAHVGALKGDDG